MLYTVISNTANGAVSGKEKITIEAFWQMRLFDRIIRRANVRLMKMSDGRYELVRRTDIGLQRNRGLDLDIKDHWNGKARDVKSLSGGESFMASLALSLALSEEYISTRCSLMRASVRLIRNPSTTRCPFCRLRQAVAQSALSPMWTR